MTKRTWPGVRALHEAAVADYAAAARALAGTAGRWHAPRADRKWSPAQITEHLALAFEAVTRELRDGVAMQVRTRAWQRVLLRFTYQRRLLRHGIFPSGARAPRETRPVTGAAGAGRAPADTAPDEVTDDAAAAIARFEDCAAELTARLDAVMERAPATRVTHPYFGRITIIDATFISARHIEHHRRQLPAPGA